MAVHIPPSIRAVYSLGMVRDLEAWLTEIIQQEVRRRVDEVAVSPYMTPGQAAKWLGCHRRRVDDLCLQGRLQRHHEGRRLLLLRSDVEALVNRDGDHDW